LSDSAGRGSSVELELFIESNSTGHQESREILSQKFSGEHWKQKRSLRLQVSLHSGDEIHIFEWSIMSLIVDKERWNAVDPTANSPPAKPARTLARNSRLSRSVSKSAVASLIRSVRYHFFVKRRRSSTGLATGLTI
jgi:hypothetical protein